MCMRSGLTWSQCAAGTYMTSCYRLTANLDMQFSFIYSAKRRVCLSLAVFQGRKSEKTNNVNEIWAGRGFGGVM